MFGLGFVRHLENRIKTLDDALDIVLADNDKLTKQNQELVTKNMQLEANVRLLNQMVNDLDYENGELSKEISRLEVSSLVRELKELRKRVEYDDGPEGMW